MHIEEQKDKYLYRLLNLHKFRLDRPNGEDISTYIQICQSTNFRNFKIFKKKIEESICVICRDLARIK